MKNYILFRNDGEIDPNALKLLGASTKRNDSSKIGFFGSGLKYALAYLLRKGVETRIFSGNTEIKLSTKRSQFRDQSFDVICVNGSETSLTTSMGIDWKGWFAVREIYCNAIDEGGCSILTIEADSNNLNTEIGETRIYVEETQELAEVMSNFSYYFAVKREAIYTDGHLRVLRGIGSNANLYRKGIRCSDMRFRSLFDYDFKNIQINESRVIPYTWIATDIIAKSLKECIDKEIIRKLLSLCTDHKEDSDDFVEYSAMKKMFGFSETWLKVIGNSLVIPKELFGWYEDQFEKGNTIVLPVDTCESLKSQFGDKIRFPDGMFGFGSSEGNRKYKVIEPNEFEIAMVRRVREFFKAVSYPIDYVIEFGAFAKDHILAHADIERQRIVLTKKLCERGFDEVLSAIIEEQVHLKTKYSDETREFQNALIMELLTYMRKNNAIIT